MQSLGVPVAGAMDLRSHRIANALVGNPAGAASLEITLTGPELHFEDERLVAVCGATFDVSVDGEPVSGASYRMHPGGRIRFAERRNGARAYLAIAGGIAVPALFGSRATHLGSRMGGLDGRALAAGDRIPLGAWSASAARERRQVRLRTGAVAAALVSAQRGASRCRLRVLLGPHVERFTPGALHVLQSGSYLVGSDSDRMGFRLQGPALGLSRGADMISDVTPAGGLQVPPSGRPMLLMADRQTTGGYPIIATVITADMPAAAQLAPGDALGFAVCTQAEAVAALIAQERVLMAIEVPA
jgi:biotin-dependent carboxylase-like uncharacterized protein